MLAFLLIPIFALANRFVGGGFTQPQGPIPHFGGLLRRPIYVTAVALFLGLTVAFGFPGAMIALGYVAYREPGWRVIFGAELDFSRTNYPFLRMMARSLFALPLATAAANPLFGAAAVLLFSALAVVAYLAGNENQARNPHENAVMEVAEPLAGAAYGLTAALILTLSPY